MVGGLDIPSPTPQNKYSYYCYTSRTSVEAILIGDIYVPPIVCRRRSALLTLRLILSISKIAYRARHLTIVQYKVLPVQQKRASFCPSWGIASRYMFKLGVFFCVF